MERGKNPFPINTVATNLNSKFTDKSRIFLILVCGIFTYEFIWFSIIKLKSSCLTISLDFAYQRDSGAKNWGNDVFQALQPLISLFQYCRWRRSWRKENYFDGRGGAAPVDKRYIANRKRKRVGVWLNRSRSYLHLAERAVFPVLQAWKEALRRWFKVRSDGFGMNSLFSLAYFNSIKGVLLPHTRDFIDFHFRAAIFWCVRLDKCDSVLGKVWFRDLIKFFFRVLVDSMDNRCKNLVCFSDGSISSIISSVFYVTPQGPNSQSITPAVNNFLIGLLNSQSTSVLINQTLRGHLKVNEFFFNRNILGALFDAWNEQVSNYLGPKSHGLQPPITTPRTTSVPPKAPATENGKRVVREVSLEDELGKIRFDSVKMKSTTPINWKKSGLEKISEGWSNFGVSFVLFLVVFPPIQQFNWYLSLHIICSLKSKDSIFCGILFSSLVKSDRSVLFLMLCLTKGNDRYLWWRSKKSLRLGKLIDKWSFYNPPTFLWISWFLAAFSWVLIHPIFLISKALSKTKYWPRSVSVYKESSAQGCSRTSGYGFRQELNFWISWFLPLKLPVEIRSNTPGPCWVLFVSSLRLGTSMGLFRCSSFFLDINENSLLILGKHLLNYSLLYNMILMNYITVYYYSCRIRPLYKVVDNKYFHMRISWLLSQLRKDLSFRWMGFMRYHLINCCPCYLRKMLYLSGRINFLMQFIFHLVTCDLGCCCPSSTGLLRKIICNKNIQFESYSFAYRVDKLLALDSLGVKCPYVVKFLSRKTFWSL